MADSDYHLNKQYNLFSIGAVLLFMAASALLALKGERFAPTVVFFMFVGAFVLLMRNSEALVAAIHAIPFLGVFSFGGVTALVSLLGLVLGVFLWRLVGRIKCIINPPVIFTLLFFIYAVVNLYLSGQSDLAFGLSNLKLYLIRGVAPALLIITFNDQIQRLRIFYSATLVFTVMAIVLSIMSYTGLTHDLKGTWDESGRIGLFGLDPISFSLPFGIAAVIAYHHFLNSKKLYFKLLSVLYLCAAFIAIIPTGSRQTFVALAAGILIYTYFAYPSMGKRFFMGMVTCFLIGVALLAVTTMVKSDRYNVTSSGYNSNKKVSFAGRITTMQKGLDTFTDSPLVGAGSGGHGKPIYTTNPRTGKQVKDKEHVHNLFIELLAEHGLIGFTLFIISMVLAVNGLLKKLRQADLDIVTRSNLSLLLGLMGFSVIQANISGGLAVSGGFISMLVAWMSIMSNLERPKVDVPPVDTDPAVTT